MPLHRLHTCAVLAVALFACGEDPARPDDSDDLARFVPEPARDPDARIEVTAIEKIDVLFVIDDSGSMKQEHDALRMQFPRMVVALVTGDIDADDEPEFAGVSDLHLGVITPDLGVGFEGVQHCEGAGGDGLLQHAPTDAGCEGDYPSFLSYRADDGGAEVLANDFACVATLGTDGCGFEQPLEAALKGLWQADDERVSFLPSSGGSPSGHGAGANAGFSRGVAEQDPSLLILVVMSDEDDCSAWDNGIFSPPELLAPGDPLQEQPLNLRCSQSPDELYPIARYTNAFQLLREGAEHLVMFALIAGVPPDLVSEDRMADLDYQDAASREAFYDTILEHPRMQETIDPASMATAGVGNLEASCETETVRAYPPRRLVTLARSFGENGVVQSICQDDYAQAMGRILERIAHRMRNPMGPS